MEAGYMSVERGGKHGYAQMRGEECLDMPILLRYRVSRHGVMLLSPQKSSTRQNVIACGLSEFGELRWILQTTQNDEFNCLCCWT